MASILICGGGPRKQQLNWQFLILAAQVGGGRPLLAAGSIAA